MPFTELLQSCSAIYPELILCLTILIVMVGDMFAPVGRSRSVSGCLALVGVIWALLVHMTGDGAVGQVFRGMIVIDSMGCVFRMLFLLGTAMVIIFSLSSRATAGYRQGEYFSLLLGGALGACFLASANNFIPFVLGLETLSMVSYVLAGFLKRDRASAEAALKYMLYGAVASGVMLFGISYLYGLTGTLDIDTGIRWLTIRLMSGEPPMTILLAAVLVLTGVGFKMALVPFHFWCPDVYQGAPTPVTAFLSVVSKAAGFSALLRLALPILSARTVASVVVPGTSLMLPILFGVLAVVTMTFGNLVALRQTNVKRLLAYSSIAHAGYILMGMTVMSPAAFEAMMAYFVIYLFMNLGAFWVVIVMENRRGGCSIGHFRGVGYQSPLLCVAMVIFLIALTGLPPTAGFSAKLLLFNVVIGAGISAMQGGAITPVAALYFLLALVGVLNSAVSLYYYMKIVRSMAFEKPEGDEPLTLDLTDRFYALALAVPSIALINFGPVLAIVAFDGWFK